MIDDYHFFMSLHEKMKKSLMENFIFCAVCTVSKMISVWLHHYVRWESDIYGVAAVLRNHKSSDFHPTRHVLISPTHSIWNYRVALLNTRTTMSNIYLSNIYTSITIHQTKKWFTLFMTRKCTCRKRLEVLRFAFQKRFLKGHLILATKV